MQPFIAQVQVIKLFLKMVNMTKQREFDESKGMKTARKSAKIFVERQKRAGGPFSWSNRSRNYFAV